MSEIDIENKCWLINGLKLTHSTLLKRLLKFNLNLRLDNPEKSDSEDCDTNLSLPKATVITVAYNFSR